MTFRRIMIKFSSLTCIRKAFILLAATGVIVLVYFMTSSPVADNGHRPADFPLSPEQCPKYFKDCSKRVLKINKSTKWIAIWLPAELQMDVSRFASIPGWKTVVVGDGFCPQGCSYPTCVFLDPASQIALGTTLVSLLPPNDPSKKNIAYLYAIKQGAHFIYDGDVSVLPLYNLTDFNYGDTSGVVYTRKGVFNYYKHYGEHWFRPPGWVDSNQSENDPAGYVLADISQPEVQHGPVIVLDRSGPRFQSVVPNVFVGSESYAPFHSSNTLFHKRAFWGLFTFPRPISDLLRSYVLQVLLKYVHGYVGFLRPNAVRNPIYAAKKPSRKIQTNLLSFLHDWECSDDLDLSTCMTQLSSDLMMQDFINDEESLDIVAWLSDLALVGYEVSDIPVRLPSSLTREINKIEKSRPNTTQFVLSPRPGVYYMKNPKAKTYKQVTQICEDFHYPERDTYKFDDILLIVTFNYAFVYKGIIYVESLYRRNFPHILFCGPDIEGFRLAAQSFPVNSTVAYVTGLERGWTFLQECTVYAMKMNFNVRGYLQIGDDTLINPWNLRALPRDQMWFNRYTLGMTRNLVNETRWSWWSQPNGKAAIDKTFSHIEKTAQESRDSKEKRFYNQYLKNVKTFNRVFRQTCDFFYIPNRLKEDFIYFTKLFFKSNLMNELAVPAIMLGLDDRKNTTRVAGKILWGPHRYEPEKQFNSEEVFLHAFKGMAQMKKPNCKTFMCETFLPTLVERMDNSDNEP